MTCTNEAYSLSSMLSVLMSASWNQPERGEGSKGAVLGERERERA